MIAWKRLGDELWVWPVAAALVIILLGYEPWRGAVGAVAHQWNVMLFILGLMGLSAAAQESGAFAWITDIVLAAAGGSRRRLFVLLFGLAALVTIVLSNDATAIVLTPIVYRAIAKQNGDADPFLFAGAFVANTASFGLPFSNPANVLVLPHPHLATYVWHLGPPVLGALAINLSVFLFFFRRRLQGRYATVIPGHRTPRARLTLYAMCLVAPAYVIGLLLGWPIGGIAIGGAAVCGIIAGVPFACLAQLVAWRIFGLLAGLFVLFDALLRAGFVVWAMRSIDDVVRYGGFAVEAIAVGGAAVLSNVFNNLPVAVASSYLVQRAPAEHLAYPLIAGIDVGPNLLATGSLATILWLTILRGYGVRINLLEYFALGAMVVPPTLAVCVGWLWFIH